MDTPTVFHLRILGNICIIWIYIHNDSKAKFLDLRKISDRNSLDCLSQADQNFPLRVLLY